MNELTTVPPARLELSFNLGKSKHLYLDNNQITTLPPQIGNLANLEILYLDNNQLTTIPPKIGELGRINNTEFRTN